MHDRHLLFQGLPGAHSTQKRGGLARKAVIDYSNAHTNTNVTISEEVYVTYTCAHAHARAHTHTHRHTRKCPTVARWHPTAVKPTADQMRVLEILKQLADAADWRAWQRRSARPGRWQPPWGLRCR
jgi:hypothetical protein